MAEGWRVEQVDTAGHTTGVALQVAEGKLEWSQFRAVQGTGSLTVAAVPGSLDLLAGRVRITHLADGVATPMGVWLISASQWGRTSARTTTELALMDMTELLNSPTGQWLSLEAGVAPVAWVTQTLAGRGVNSTAITPSSARLSTAMHWEPTSTWLEVANDVLEAINYATLSADMQGRIVVEPYLPPGRRPVVATYGGEPDDLRMRGEWTDEAETYNLPTGFRLTVEGTDNKPGFVGSADLPDSHPLSAASRGRELLRVESGEAVNQATADDIAARKLVDALQVTRKVPIQHPVDTTQLGDVVEHRPLGLTGAIVQRTIDLGVGAVVSDTIRHIYTGGELPW